MIAFTGCSTEYYENNFKYLQLERNIVTFIYESTIIGELLYVTLHRMHWGETGEPLG